MAEILLSRYDLFVSHKMLTHITLNLSATEIESLYAIVSAPGCAIHSTFSVLKKLPQINKNNF